MILINLMFYFPCVVAVRCAQREIHLKTSRSLLTMEVSIKSSKMVASRFTCYAIIHYTMLILLTSVAIVVTSLTSIRLMNSIPSLLWKYSADGVNICELG